MIDVNKYIGIPFEDSGRSQEGVDCWGLIHLFYKNERGIEFPLYTDLYETSFDKERVSEIINEEKVYWNQIEFDELQDGDVILFRVSGLPIHVGMVVDKNTFIHCIKGAQSCLEKLNSPRSQNRIIGAFRYAQN